MDLKLVTNYIPHKKTLGVNYYKWKNYFYDDLYYMHYTTVNILKNRHDEIANINFDNFCYFIFKNSSKYIPKY